jgi:hypothetical protein
MTGPVNGAAHTNATYGTTDWHHANDAHDRKGTGPCGRCVRAR